MVEPRVITVSRVYGHRKVGIPVVVIRAAELKVKDGDEIRWSVPGPGTVVMNCIPKPVDHGKYRSMPE